MSDLFEVFLVGTPGLEPYLLEEVTENGFTNPRLIPGGVTIDATRKDIARANLNLRGATRVLVRIAQFRVFHLAQLDKRARKVDWSAHLRDDMPVAVEVSCRKSKIYHSRAAASRIEGAISKTIGTPIDAASNLKIKARIDDDMCTISIDTSGDGLHKRGLKGAVGKAPLRETLAALSLRACRYEGLETVVDPMCGSGTFVIEAAEIAAGLSPGRARRFAFEDLAWPRMACAANTEIQTKTEHFGFDRDQGAVQTSTANANRAGVTACTTFKMQAVSDLQPPQGPPGLVMVNPPYGARIGNRKQLFGLYAALGKTLKDRFSGWRVGMITSDPGLAKSCELNWVETIPFQNGGLQVALYRTDPLA